MEKDEIRAVGSMKFQCKKCYDGVQTQSFKAGIRTPVPEKFTHPQAVVDPIETNGESFFAKKEWVCNACGFQFKREPTKVMSKCPYCGKESLQQKVDDPAADFIQ